MGGPVFLPITSETSSNFLSCFDTLTTNEYGWMKSAFVPGTLRVATSFANKIWMDFEDYC
jgi:hypothetical protein